MTGISRSCTLKKPDQTFCYLFNFFNMHLLIIRLD